MRTKQSRRSRQWAAIFCIFVLFLSSLACELSDTFTWSRTLTAPSDTPVVTDTVSPADVGKISVMVDRKLIKVNLDPLGERQIDGVQLEVLELGETYLVETFDPLGRFLPTVTSIKKDREPQQEVDAVQINRTWQWSFSVGQNLDILSLMKKHLGSVQLDSLHSFSGLAWGQLGINMILPVPDVVDDNQMLDVYQTPAGHTVLLVPQGIQAGEMPSTGLGLLSPVEQVTSFSEYMVLSFFSMPAEPISAYLRAAQAMAVGDYLGFPEDDLDWAVLKVREDRAGLPLDYQPPRGIAKETVNWLNYDQRLVSSLYFIPIERVMVPCTDKDQLETVVAQFPQPGTVVNALSQPVTLHICSEVLSQSKYETVTYRTDTPTITFTPSNTFTPGPTRTPTPTGTILPSNTSKPSSTVKPSNTSAPTRTSSPKSTTATQAPSSTNASSSTSAPSSTPVPAIFDDFITSPTGYNGSYWTSIYTIGGTQGWSGAEKAFLQSVNGSGFPNIYLLKACLLGTVEFRVKTFEDGGGKFIIGWIDEAVIASMANGIYLESYSSSQAALTTLRNGTKTTTPITVSNRSTAWHTYTISWSQNPQDLSISAGISVDGGTTTLVTTNLPDERLHFIIGAIGEAAGNAAWIEIDYIKIFSNSCQ